MKFTKLSKSWQHSMIIILCIAIPPKNGICQYLATEDFQQKIVYTETKTAYYVVEDVESLTLLEKMKLKELKEERQIEKMIMANIPNRFW